MIPPWSIVIAVAAFVGVEYYFWVVLPAQRHHPAPPLGFLIYLNISWGVLAALYFLMIGYVSKDAPRRSMSALSGTGPGTRKTTTRLAQEERGTDP